MPYLIDGHNLIPKLGLRLDSVDDEQQLISRLQEFCRLRRAQVDVYFDNAPPGWAASRKMGSVTVHFVPQRSSADTAIENRLRSLGRSARNWTVVSSDERIRRAAGATHAGVASSEEFAREISNLQQLASSTGKQEATPTPEEVEEWLSVFTRQKG
jgi:uncharacterized protein